MAAGELLNTLKGFGSAVRKNSKLEHYISNSLTGAVIGGAIGGVGEGLQGGSFFEGAKSGAMTGAAVGAGYTAVKASGVLGGAGKAEARAAATQASATQAAPASASVKKSRDQIVRENWAALDERAAKVQAMRENGTLGSAQSSNWSAKGEMNRLGLPTNAQMDKYGTGISKQVQALDQLYGDVAQIRRSHGLNKRR